MSTEIHRAAVLAAERMVPLLVEMLTNGEVGEVAVVVTTHDLTPEKRVTKRARSVRVARGYSLLERA
jgi:hypothetical protein